MSSVAWRRVTCHDVSCIATGQLIYAWVMSALSEWNDDEESESVVRHHGAASGRSRRPGAALFYLWSLLGGCEQRYFSYICLLWALFRLSEREAWYLYSRTPLDEVVGKSEGFQWFESLVFVLLGKTCYLSSYHVARLSLSFLTLPTCRFVGIMLGCAYRPHATRCLCI